MHFKNIRNMKFNGYIFKIYTKKRYMRSLKNFSPNQFGEKLCSKPLMISKNKKQKKAQWMYFKYIYIYIYMYVYLSLCL